MGMTIKRNQVEQTAFEDLLVGAIFIDCDNEVNIKSINVNTNEFCAIVLDSGLMWHPHPNEPVTEIFATLVIDKE